MREARADRDRQAAMIFPAAPSVPHPLRRSCVWNSGEEKQCREARRLGPWARFFLFRQNLSRIRSKNVGCWHGVNCTPHVPRLAKSCCGRDARGRRDRDGTTSANAHTVTEVVSTQHHPHAVPTPVPPPPTTAAAGYERRHCLRQSRYAASISSSSSPFSSSRFPCKMQGLSRHCLPISPSPPVLLIHSLVPRILSLLA